MSVLPWKSAPSPTADSPSTLENYTETPNFSHVVLGVSVEKVVPCVLLASCFIMGLPVNVAIIVDICRKFKRYTSGVNPSILLLVLNLAVVDSMILSTSPIFIYSIFWGWSFGEAFCIILFNMVNCYIFMSVFTVTGLSIRYFLNIKMGVADPRLMARISRRRRHALFLGGLWTVTLLLSISKQVAILLLETVIGFLVPFSILLVSYICFYKGTKETAFVQNSAQQRKKLSCFVFSVLVTFLICWTPYHIINMLDVSMTLLMTSSPDVYTHLKTFRNAAGNTMKSLCFLNSTINPFLYAFTLWRKLNRKEASSSHCDNISSSGI